MPVTSFHPSSAVAPRSEAAGAPPRATMPAGDVGHGVTRLMERPPAYATNAPFIPGTPPPTRETAGAHGAHKGRISIR
jgi:hypothetical protein